MLLKRLFGITVKIQDGSLTLRVSIAGGSPLLFIGHTGEGVFPQVGVEYEEFCCEPSGGQQIMVFKDSGSFRLFTILWKDDKMECREGSELPISIHRRGFSLQAQIDGLTYVTDRNIPTGEYNVIDALSILQYLEGSISKEELEDRAEAFVVASKILAM